MGSRLAALGLLAGALTAGLAGGEVDHLREGRTPGSHLLYLPRGEYLRVVTFGYRELFADLIYIWSIQYYSNYQIEDRYDYLDQIYRRVIAELDPRFIDPLLLGSMIMSVEANRDELALRLLDQGMEHNPGEWILPFQAGFLCYYKLKDFARAQSYFARAMALPGAPPAARRLQAEMHNRMGDKPTALRFWSEINASADSDYVRRVSWMHVHDLTIEVDLDRLAAAVQSFQERHGHLPPALESLRRDRLVASLPVDPDGNPYLYDPSTGRVRSQTRLLLGR